MGSVTTFPQRTGVSPLGPNQQTLASGAAPALHRGPLRRRAAVLHRSRPDVPGTRDDGDHNAPVHRGDREGAWSPAVWQSFWRWSGNSLMLAGTSALLATSAAFWLAM